MTSSMSAPETTLSAEQLETAAASSVAANDTNIGPASTSDEQSAALAPDVSDLGKEQQAAPSSALTWPELNKDHPLTQFSSKLKSLLEQADYDEVYGIKLVVPADFHTYLILQKFLRANANDLEKAHTQLLATLKWRKSFQPLKTLDEAFSRERFGGLGFITDLNKVPGSLNEHDVATFNLYGAVKDPKVTFEDVDGFLRWRVGLMELSLQKLNLREARKPIPDYSKGADPYQAIQVHDYMQVSFLRQNAYTKAASKKAIDTFKDYYPETLSRKFFVNVPVIMGWMFNAVSLVLSKETLKKFTVLSYGNTLNSELGNDVPEVYGGKGQALEGRGVGPILQN